MTPSRGSLSRSRKQACLSYHRVVPCTVLGCGWCSRTSSLGPCGEKTKKQTLDWRRFTRTLEARQPNKAQGHTLAHAGSCWWWKQTHRSASRCKRAWALNRSASATRIPPLLLCNKQHRQGGGMSWPIARLLTLKVKLRVRRPSPLRVLLPRVVLYSPCAPLWLELVWFA